MIYVFYWQKHAIKLKVTIKFIKNLKVLHFFGHPVKKEFNLSFASATVYNVNMITN